MNGPDEVQRSGKSKSVSREERLALKLRQNLVRRKEKVRAQNRVGQESAAGTGVTAFGNDRRAGHDGSD